MILVCVILLCGIGGAMVGSVEPSLLSSQVWFYFVGFILFFIFSFLDVRIFSSLSKHVYVISLVFLIGTLLLGLESRGAVRWVSIGPMRLQFSELLKPFLIMSLAGFMSNNYGGKFKDVIKIIGLIILPVILVIKQPDLGSGIIYSFAFGAMIFVSGISLGYFLLGGIGMIVTLPLIWHFLAEYQKHRIMSFIAPSYDPLGTSYNAIQAMVAVGSGMFFGLGLGHGTQSHLMFLPERHTDFIFASSGEELGFVGIFIILVIYLLLILRIFRVAFRTKSRFEMLSVIGIGMVILAQVFINCGMNLGILPVTGITLPLISYGGSSVLSTMVGLGIIESIVKSRNS